MTNPLELPLRDIHLPGAVSFWPPAPGWWILAALIITSTLIGWFLYQRNRRLKLSATRLAREELGKIIARYETDKDPLNLLMQLSILLRRLSISLFPRIEVASLTGQAWLEFLDRKAALNSFTNGEGKLLCEAPYRPAVTADEAALVLKHCQNWIENVTTGKRR